MNELRKFQPTRPLRGATVAAAGTAQECRISTHAPLAGRDISLVVHRVLHGISTHAPLAGRDFVGEFALGPQTYFNPRAPCGARPASQPFCGHEWPFQPTRPLRGATSRRRALQVCGRISTHAPLAGRDVSCTVPGWSSYPFQPTRPLRGATIGNQIGDAAIAISTHAPLAGRDRLKKASLLPTCISTHAPLAGRDAG